MPEDDKPSFCINCKHCNPNHQEGCECRHPDLLEYNLVTGEPKPVFCAHQRTDDGTCGKSGELFEPKAL